MKINVKTLELIELKADFALNGNLTVIQSFSDVPFPFFRIFYVNGMLGSVRGQHAHKECSQFLTCPVGSVSISCDDGKEKKIFILDRPNCGLLIPPGIWAEQTYMKDKSLLLVLCDKEYNESEYIRNYNDFIKYAN
jgi:dTDP-4-dehydrorhamnose 3,5-epimerase-like enzyme